MAVPGGDARDLKFANKYKLDVIDIYKDDKFINSSFLDKKNDKEANKLIIEDIKKNKYGSIDTYYKLKD
jgi:leucyl-tRNA synthetase